MNSQTIYVITIANSIIGVGILTMPYCFKQCGILLSTLILILSSILSRISCHLLLKSAIISRRRTFEVLAFHAFGSLGKFVIELGIIGFLIGTCVAFFVVMGDLGPSIIGKMSGIAITDTVRTSILLALALFCVLPLGLLRNIDSLSSVCTATIGFYFCLVLKVIAESLPHLFSGDWFYNVEWWRPAGILQCLPIFSMALFCQTQLFEIYQSIPNASLEKMNNLIRQAVNICTGVYIFVGIFGYIAFSHQTLTGNILMSFTPSLLSDVMKIGFVLSVAFSFPMVIFPCRASLNSFFYKKTYVLHDGSANYIPEGRFKALTFLIVLVSLTAGVLTPNIERVLGLVGSIIGILICVIFPATCFICISSKNTNERIIAQVILFIGIIVMVLGTYSNLYATQKSSYDELQFSKILDIPDKTILITKLRKNRAPFNLLMVGNLYNVLAPNLDKLDMNSLKIEEKAKNENQQNENVLKVSIEKEIKNSPVELTVKPADETIKEIRHEPPQPVEPLETKDEIKEPHQLDDSKIPDTIKLQNDRSENQVGTNIEKKIPVAEIISKVNRIESPKLVSTEMDKVVVFETNADIKGKLQQLKIEEVDIEAIKKEEKELQDQEKEKVVNSDIIKQLEYKNILKELKQHKKHKEEIKKINDADLKVVNNLENMMKQAIEKLNAEKEVDRNNLPSKVANSAAFNTESKLPSLNMFNKNMSSIKPLPIVLAMANNFSQTQTINSFNTERSSSDNKAILHETNIAENIVSILPDQSNNSGINKLLPRNNKQELPNTSIKQESQVSSVNALKASTNQTVHSDAKDTDEIPGLHREIRSINDTHLLINKLNKYDNNSEKTLPTNSALLSVSNLTKNVPGKLMSKLDEKSSVEIFENDGILKHVQRDLKSLEFQVN